MPSIVDALIVEFGLDPSQFDKEEKKVAAKLAGFKQRTRQSAKESEDAINGLAAGFEKMTRDMVAFFGSVVSLRALVSFAKDIIETNRQLGIMADVTQESVQRLSGLGNVFERLGGSSQKVLAVIAAWDAELKAMEIGAMDPNNSKLVRVLNTLTAIGVRVERTQNGKVRKPLDLFVEIAEKISKSGASKDIKTALLRAAGLDDETIAVMLRGGDAMRAYLKEQEKIYQVTEEQRNRTDQINRQWAELTQRVKSLGQETLILLADGFDKVLSGMRRILDFLNNTFSDPKSIFFLPSVGEIKEYFKTRGSGGAPSGGGSDAGVDVWSSLPGGGGISGKGAMGGTVHGHGVDPYGGLSGQELFEPMTGTMGGGVGGHSAKFGPGHHEGVDIMGRVGSSVYASRPGTVISAGREGGGLDQVLTIDHGDGTFSRYLHQGPSKVQPGDKVIGGQMIGSSGYRNAPHTHFEMWRGKPGGAGSALINPKALYGWDKDNPAVGGRRVIGRGPNDGGQASKDAAGGMWDRGAPPMQFRSPIQLRPQSSINNSRTDISSVNVQTGATDASAIAGDIARELKRQMRESLPSQQLINSRNPAEANAAMLAAEQARTTAEAR